MPVILALVGPDLQVLRAHWPASLAKLINVRFSETCLRKCRWRVMRGDTHRHMCRHHTHRENVPSTINKYINR